MSITIRFLLAAGLALALPALAAAQDKPTLTVYTYSSFAGEYGPGDKIKANFEATCGCTLTWVETEDSGTLLARLKLEGPSSPADIVLGLDTNLMAEAKASGLFAPSGVDVTSLQLPVAWTDDTFIPFDWGWFAFVYDSSKLAQPPASLTALIEDANGPTVVIEDPRTSSPGLGLLAWMQKVYGDQAPAMWAKLKPRIVTVTKGWSEAYGLFLDGEADMVLSYTTSPAYHIGAEGKDQYKAAIFPEGHYLQVEVAALVAGSRNQDLARSFLKFMVSDGFQSTVPEGNWMYPATEPASGLPASFSTLGTPDKSLLFTPEEMEAGRRGWIDAWLGAMGL
jgi:thiamine transport system substrate-binding protein